MVAPPQATIEAAAASIAACRDSNTLVYTSVASSQSRRLASPRRRRPTRSSLVSNQPVRWEPQDLLGAARADTGTPPPLGERNGTGHAGRGPGPARTHAPAQPKNLRKYPPRAPPPCMHPAPLRNGRRQAGRQAAAEQAKRAGRQAAAALFFFPTFFLARLDSSRFQQPTKPTTHHHHRRSVGGLVVGLLLPGTYQIWQTRRRERHTSDTPLQSKLNYLRCTCSLGYIHPQSEPIQTRLPAFRV